MSGQKWGMLSVYLEVDDLIKQYHKLEDKIPLVLLCGACLYV